MATKSVALTAVDPVVARQLLNDEGRKAYIESGAMQMLKATNKDPEAEVPARRTDT